MIVFDRLRLVRRDVLVDDGELKVYWPGSRRRIVFDQHELADYVRWQKGAEHVDHG